VYQPAGIGQDDALGGRVADIAFMPESNILHRRHRETTQDTRETTHALTKFRIAFMRHGRGALLSCGEWLKCFA